MKKSLLCLALCAFALIGCGEPTSSAPEEQQYQIYLKAVEEGSFSGTYEEWLASIKGKDGKDGKDGVNGKDGASVLLGEGAPADSLGTNGDSYVDTSTFDFYTKSNDVWTKVGSLKGADGEGGFDGKNGLNGKDGNNGLSILSGNKAPEDTLGSDGELYIDTATFNLYKKVEGSWTLVGNIKGEKGDKGEDAINYYPNTFLPSEGGFIYSDKGSYAANETIKLTSKANSKYELKAIEVIYDGTKTIYATSTGLDDFLANGIKAKENGYVFKPIYLDTAKSFTETDLTKIGEKGSGKYSLSNDAYGAAASGITISSTGEFVSIEGKVDEAGNPATTIYLSAKSVFNSDYLLLKNIKFVLADSFSDTSILEFKNTFTSIENCSFSIEKEIDTAIKFDASNFGIKDVKIESGKNETSGEAYLSTAVLFGEKEENKLVRAVVDGFNVNNVKKVDTGLYKGSVFKSFYDASYFVFEIKNSTFGTSENKLGEIWTHFRQKDNISTRFGIDADLYKKFQKTSSLKISDTSIYSSLTNDTDWYRNPAIITFRLMQSESDDSYETRRVFADILLEVANTKVNDALLTTDNVKYGAEGKIPLVTLYLYNSSDEVWAGNYQINTYNAVYPYATIDGADANLTYGQYPAY